ncbi:MAG: hypothetical protein Q8R44_19485 [Novosphingobium sp.]|nr:hypothetical protein [Novosphingobium sp.]
MSRTRIALIIVALALTPPATAGAKPIDADWPEVARAEDGDCALSVTGEGRFFRIEASGLGTEAPARFFLSNGDMKPLDWSIRADGDGGFARYYLPFRWHREGDQVLVSIQSARCGLITTFAWERAQIVVR